MSINLGGNVFQYNTTCFRHQKPMHLTSCSFKGVDEPEIKELKTEKKSAKIDLNELKSKINPKALAMTKLAGIAAGLLLLLKAPTPQIVKENFSPPEFLLRAGGQETVVKELDNIHQAGKTTVFIFDDFGPSTQTFEKLLGWQISKATHNYSNQKNAYDTNCDGVPDAFHGNVVVAIDEEYNPNLLIVHNKGNIGSNQKESLANALKHLKEIEQMSKPGDYVGLSNGLMVNADAFIDAQTFLSQPNKQIEAHKDFNGAREIIKMVPEWWEVIETLDRITAKGVHVIVGDANTQDSVNLFTFAKGVQTVRHDEIGNYQVADYSTGKLDAIAVTEGSFQLAQGQKVLSLENLSMLSSQVTLKEKDMFEPGRKSSLACFKDGNSLGVPKYITQKTLD